MSLIHVQINVMEDFLVPVGEIKVAYAQHPFLLLCVDNRMARNSGPPKADVTIPTGILVLIIIGNP